MIVGNFAQSNKIYYGDGHGGFLSEESISSSSGNTLAVATGDLNNDGNLDLATALLGVQSEAVLAVSEALVFDAAAIVARQVQLRQLDFASNGNSDVNVTLVDIVVGQQMYSSRSECRAPADLFYLVTARLRIEFPLVSCTTPECIILGPLEAINPAVRCSHCMWNARSTYPVMASPKACLTMPFLLRS